jgi:lipopolysaccharide transport system ATP-binding protein
VAHYLQAEGGAGSQRSWPDIATAPGGKRVRLREVRVVDEKGQLVDSVDIRQPVGIEISFTLLRDDVPVFPKIKVTDREGNNAFNTVDTSPLWKEPLRTGDYVATAWIPGNLLNEGLYTVEPGVSSLGAIGSNKLVHQARASDAVAFHVYDPGLGDTSKGAFAGQFRGSVRPLLEWTSERR